MTGRSVPVRAVPGLLLALVDALIGWLLYDAVAPVFGLVLWSVAALVVVALLLDGDRRAARRVDRSPGTLVRE